MKTNDTNAKMVPGPEVVAKKTRRKMTAQYKLEILVEAVWFNKPKEEDTLKSELNFIEQVSHFH